MKKCFSLVFCAMVLLFVGCEPTAPTSSSVFSVSANKQVTFSKGNLQYHPANNKWRFAENQTDYIGAANKDCSPTYNGWLDLFGWSTNANTYGVSTSISSSDYDGSFVDWGTNKIDNDAPTTWRTLTYEEWDYLFWKRSNHSKLCGVAQVNGVNGLILLPDNWECPSDITFKSGFHNKNGVDYYADYQIFTAYQWAELETAGAVFFPAAGERLGSGVNTVQGSGFYWSASKGLSSRAATLYFYSGYMGMGDCDRSYGQSVRLVKDL